MRPTPKEHDELSAVSLRIDAPAPRRYGLAMWSLRPRTLPTGFVPPCLPTGAPCAPSGTEWLHEIKHDGIRVIARKQDQRIKLYSRPGNDLTQAVGRVSKRVRVDYP